MWSCKVIIISVLSLLAAMNDNYKWNKWSKHFDVIERSYKNPISISLFITKFISTNTNIVIEDKFSKFSYGYHQKFFLWSCTEKGGYLFGSV